MMVRKFDGYFVLGSRSLSLTPAFFPTIVFLADDQSLDLQLTQPGSPTSSANLPNTAAEIDASIDGGFSMANASSNSIVHATGSKSTIGNGDDNLERSFDLSQRGGGRVDGDVTADGNRNGKHVVAEKEVSGGNETFGEKEKEKETSGIVSTERAQLNSTQDLPTTPKASPTATSSTNSIQETTSSSQERPGIGASKDVDSSQSAETSSKSKAEATVGDGDDPFKEGHESSQEGLQEGGNDSLGEVSYGKPSESSPGVLQVSSLIHSLSGSTDVEVAFDVNKSREMLGFKNGYEDFYRHSHRNLLYNTVVLTHLLQSSDTSKFHTIQYHTNDSITANAFTMLNNSSSDFRGYADPVLGDETNLVMLQTLPWLRDTLQTQNMTVEALPADRWGLIELNNSLNTAALVHHGDYNLREVIKPRGESFECLSALTIFESKS